jgi:putative transposase
MDRTLVLNLRPTPEQAAILRRTLTEHTACFNAVAHEGFTQQCSNGVELHRQTYYPLRAQYPDLPAQLVCAARVKATEAVKSVLTWQKKHTKNFPKRVEKAKQLGKPVPVFKPVRCPQVQLCPIRYDMRSYWVNWQTSIASLATVAGRVELSFTVPAHAAKYSGGKVCSADLCYRKGKWSTKSAKRHLKRLSGKLFRQRRDHDHILSKYIVQNAPPGSTIVIENLTYIRDRAAMKKHTETQRRLHSWSFAQFHSFLTYKAQERGIQVAKVDPRHTSQTCSQCGYQHRSNRRSQSLFLCRRCGFSLNADLNASRNIRDKYLASFGISLAGGPLSDGLSSQSSD